MSEFIGPNPEFDETSNPIDDFEDGVKNEEEKDPGTQYAEEIINSIQEDDIKARLRDTTLSDEELHLLEDSGENVIPYETIAVEIRNHLKQLGLEKPQSIDETTIRELSFEYSLDKFRSEALFLHTRSTVDKALGIYFPVTYTDLVQQSKKLDVDKLQRQQSYKSQQVLEDHGLPHSKVMEWSLLGGDTTERIMFRIAWLLDNEPSLEVYSKRLIDRAKKNGVTIEGIAERCLQIMEEECRNHVEAQYVPESQTDIDLKAYKLKAQRLENARVLAELAFVELQNSPINPK